MDVTSRIRELRRRHFGRGGKTEFAQRLGLDLIEYDRIERGAIPAGDVLVRMCDVTGEDLQWLLTGHPGRGTVVIANAMRRHQALLGKIAAALDSNPAFAGPVEAFLDLLLARPTDAGRAGHSLPPPAASLIPIYGPGRVPRTLPRPDGGDSPGGVSLLPLDITVPEEAWNATALFDPEGPAGDPLPARIASLRFAGHDSAADEVLDSPSLARLFPGAFGVRVRDDEMSPMFSAGDALLVCPGVAPKLGHAALCLFDQDEEPLCRIWLGNDGTRVNLGGVRSGRHDELPAEHLRWSLDVLYRVAAA